MGDIIAGPAADILQAVVFKPLDLQGIFVLHVFAPSLHVDCGTGRRGMGIADHLLNAQLTRLRRPSPLTGFASGDGRRFFKNPRPS